MTGPGAVHLDGRERWWHQFAGICPHGIYIATTLGDSLTHPEALFAETGGAYESSVLCGSEGCTTALHYVRSWDHEPTDAEVEAATPEEYKD